MIPCKVIITMIQLLSLEGQKGTNQFKKRRTPFRGKRIRSAIIFSFISKAYILPPIYIQTHRRDEFKRSLKNCKKVMNVHYMC